MKCGELDSYHAQMIAQLTGRLDQSLPKNLHRVKVAWRQLGSPLLSTPVVLVGGTNGKGTVCGLLAMMLRCHGLKVGLYTSPHVVCLTERCQISGVSLALTDFSEAGYRLKALLKHDFESLSAFELVTLVSFALMAHHQVDVAVVEVGMGGEYDATNVLEPWVSVITSIGQDHMPELGRSLAEVAATKAGIRRQDRPLVIGQDAWGDGDKDDHLKLFWQQLEHDDKIFVGAQTSDLAMGVRLDELLSWLPSYVGHVAGAATDNLAAGRGGALPPALRRNDATARQAYNALISQMAAPAWRKVWRPDDAGSGISASAWPYVLLGRAQWWPIAHAICYLDTAHNPQAFGASVAWFNEVSMAAAPEDSPCGLGVVHFRRDKQPQVLLAQALAAFYHTIVFGGGAYSAGADLIQAAASCGGSWEYQPTFTQAWQRVGEFRKRVAAPQRQLIYVGGSFFALRAFLAHEEASGHPLNQGSLF